MALGRRGGFGLVSTALILWALLAYADNTTSTNAPAYRLAVVNLGQLLNEAPQSLAETKRLEALFSKRESELAQEKLQLDNALQALQVEKETTPATEFLQKERELRTKQRDYLRKFEDFREEVSSSRNDALQKVQDLIDRAVEQVRERDSIDIVFRESHYVAASQRVNMTQEVLVYLQQQFEAEQAKSPSSTTEPVTVPSKPAKEEQ